jgi:hypothetical protein
MGTGFTLTLVFTASWFFIHGVARKQGAAFVWIAVVYMVRPSRPRTRWLCPDDHTFNSARSPQSSHP